MKFFIAIVVFDVSFGVACRLARSLSFELADMHTAPHKKSVCVRYLTDAMLEAGNRLQTERFEGPRSGDEGPTGSFADTAEAGASPQSHARRLLSRAGFSLASSSHLPSSHSPRHLIVLPSHHHAPSRRCSSSWCGSGRARPRAGRCKRATPTSPTATSTKVPNPYLLPTFPCLPFLVVSFPVPCPASTAARLPSMKHEGTW